jgi:hypothetical protein
MRPKVDEWKRATDNANRRASERLRFHEQVWPVLLVRLRLADAPLNHIQHFQQYTSVKKRWSRRHQLQNSVEHYESLQQQKSLNPAQRS